MDIDGQSVHDTTWRNSQPWHTLNEVAEDEPMGEVEQYIRMIKEWCQSACTVLPFKRLPG